jgi:hypothetical protein
MAAIRGVNRAPCMTEMPVKMLPRVILVATGRDRQSSWYPIEFIAFVVLGAVSRI